MIGTFVFLLFVTLLGVPFAVWLDRSSRGADLVARSTLIGLPVAALALFLLSAAGVPWTRLSLVAGSLVLLIPPLWVIRRGANVEKITLAMPEKRPALAWIFDVVTLLTAAGYALFATSAVPEFDFLSDWGLKGRVFFEHGGIDWKFLEHATYRATHADYPLLLPLSFDGAAIFGGAWRDTSIGILYIAFGLSTLCILRQLLRRDEVNATGRALATLSFASFAFSPWIGLGEGALVAYATSALFLLVRGLHDDHPGSIRTAGVLLGIGAITKNEGLAFFCAAIVAALLIHRRPLRLLRFVWPGALVALSWQLVRAIHRLPTDLVTGAVSDRLLQHFRHPAPLLEAFSHYSVGKGLFWCCVALAILFNLKETVHRFGVALLTIALQFASYILAYASTPHDVDWHVRWSWERLVSHLALSFAFIAFVSLARLFRSSGEEGALPSDIVPPAHSASGGEKT